jgi:hypothetical protein
MPSRHHRTRGGRQRTWNAHLQRVQAARREANLRLCRIIELANLREDLNLALIKLRADVGREFWTRELERAGKDGHLLLIIPAKSSPTKSEAKRRRHLYAGIEERWKEELRRKAEERRQRQLAATRPRPTPLPVRPTAVPELSPRKTARNYVIGQLSDDATLPDYVVAITTLHAITLGGELVAELRRASRDDNTELMRQLLMRAAKVLDWCLLATF